MKRKYGFTLVELLVIAAIIGVLVALVIPASQEARETAVVSTLRGPVNDDAKILTEAQVQSLSDVLLTYEKKTSNQIVILTISTLDGRDIGQFAIDTAKNWKLGQKDKDNGVLFVIAVKEHKTWITTGRGIGDKLTDVDCRHILADKVKPAFKAGNYAAGICAAITAIEVKLSGKADPVGAKVLDAEDAAVSFWFTGWGITLIVIITVVVIILLIVVANSGSNGLLSALSDSGGSSGNNSSSGGFSGGDFGGGGAGGDW
jgi:uncharacterized protein